MLPEQSGQYFAPNPMLFSFGFCSKSYVIFLVYYPMDFALKFRVEDQKMKRSSSQNLRLLDHVHSICLAVS